MLGEVAGSRQTVLPNMQRRAAGEGHMSRQLERVTSREKSDSDNRSAF